MSINPIQAEHYDVAIIGGGPGGYVAAVRSAQLGFKTACIDKRKTLGGTCLNVGCIPSKALLQSSEYYAFFKQHSQQHGIKCNEISFDFSEMMRRQKQIISTLAKEVSDLFRKHQIYTFEGKAEFIDPQHIRIIMESEVKEISATHFIIATGSQSTELPNLLIDEQKVVSSTGALNLKQVPSRLVVIGGGVIGVELASVYCRLGSSVMIVEMLDRICPSLDLDLSKYLLKLLKNQGIEFKLSTALVTGVVQPDEVILTIAEQEQLQNISADIVLVAVGRSPYANELKLEKAEVKQNAKGYIVVDESFRSSQPHIFAIGDVIEGPMLAHRASAEGVSVIESLKGEQPIINYLSIPTVIYTNPEVASVGLSEEEIKKMNIEFTRGKSFFKANPRARCSGETEGFVKVLGEKRSGRLLGMHIIGPHASELIAEGALAMQKHLTLKELAEAVHAHPTLSESIKEAAFNALYQ